MHRTVVTPPLLALAAAASATLVLAFAPPAGGGVKAPAVPPRGDPAAFVTRVVALVVHDDYARAWASLYPAHQGVAPRDEYVSCELRSPVGSKLRTAEVVRVVQRHRRIPGSSKRIALTAVTLRLTITEAASHADTTFVHTFNAVAVGSRWTWILTPSRYELYRSDTC